MTPATGQIEKGTRDYGRANLALFIAGFVTFSTLYDVQPLLPLFVDEFGISPAASSLTLSTATFALAWTLPASGTLSDAIGRRRLMGIAVVLTSLLALASSFSDTLSSLLALRLVQGFVLAGVPAVAMAYLNDEMSPRAIGAAMGLYIAGNACGGMTGRILTAVLADFLPWRGAIAVIGILALVLSALFWVMLPPSRHFQRRPFRIGPLTVSLLGHLRDPGLFCLYLLAFLLMGGFVTLYNYVTFHLLAPPYSLSQSHVALIFLAYAFGAFGSSLMGGLTERYGRARILWTAIGIMLGGALLTLLTPLTAIVCGIVIFTGGFFGAHAVASAWVGARARIARAQASSLYLLAYYLGSSISGTGGGFVWSSWGWTGVVLLIIGLIGLAGGVILQLTAMGSRPGHDPPPTAAETLAK